MQQGTFARPGSAHHRQGFTRMELEIHTLQHRDINIAFMKTAT
jgi:hypothetical protein